MRYYDILLTDSSGNTVKEWTSHPNGQFDPGAHNVMLDFLVMNYDINGGGQTITIEGPALQDLQQAQQFTGLTVTVRGGMQAGLPLANPQQAGVLTVGSIFQSFGNWHGTEMTLDFVLMPSSFTLQTPGSIILDWKAGTPLSQPLTQTLNQAFPNYPVVMNISDQLVMPGDVPGYYKTLEQLSAVLYARTQGFLGPTYQGVRIAIQAGQIIVWDNDSPPAPVQINFQDLVGQPTWIDVNVMQAAFVMRADLTIGSTILMPQGMINAPGFVQTSANSMPSNLKYQSTFQGVFTITEMRHIGNFRDPNGQSWVTVANCVAQQQ